MRGVSAARRRLRALFGRVVAEKASPAFAMLHGRRRGLPVHLPATILEVAPRRVSVGSEVADDHRPAPTTGVRELSPLRDAASELAAARERRRRTARLARRAFVEDLSDLINLLSLAKTGNGEEGSPTTVEACWLNRSIRTTVSVDALISIVDDPRIVALDLPRRIKPELHETAGVVGAPEYRRHHNLDGRGVIVGIIDGQVFAEHPALTPRVQLRYDATGEPSTPASHATAIAGIIGSNDPDYYGIAPAATILNYKIFRSGEEGGYEFDGALAIDAALEDGVDVVNCSWGTRARTDGTSRETLMCNQAWGCGLVVIKSAGNRGLAGVTCPSDADGIIVVGATDRAGTFVVPSSGRGPTKNRLTRPHLVAPGGDDSDLITSCDVNGAFSRIGEGTSYAAAHVTGLVALLLQQDPCRTPDAIRDALLNVSRPIMTRHDDNVEGRGLVKIDR